MVEMREFHMDKVRVDSSQPTEAEVTQAVNIVGKLTPEKQLRWMLQTIYKHPFMAARVRIELKVRQHRLTAAVAREDSREPQESQLAGQGLKRRKTCTRASRDGSSITGGRGSEGSFDGRFQQLRSPGQRD